MRTVLGCSSPEKGEKLGFREAMLHASAAGWLCKASRGGREGFEWQKDDVELSRFAVPSLTGTPQIDPIAARSRLPSFCMLRSGKRAQRSSSGRVGVINRITLTWAPLLWAETPF